MTRKQKEILNHIKELEREYDDFMRDFDGSMGHIDIRNKKRTKISELHKQIEFYEVYGRRLGFADPIEIKRI